VLVDIATIIAGRNISLYFRLFLTTLCVRWYLCAFLGVNSYRRWLHLVLWDYWRTRRGLGSIVRHAVSNRRPFSCSDYLLWLSWFLLVLKHCFNVLWVYFWGGLDWFSQAGGAWVVRHALVPWWRRLDSFFVLRRWLVLDLPLRWTNHSTRTRFPGFSRIGSLRPSYLVHHFGILGLHHFPHGHRLYSWVLPRLQLLINVISKLRRGTANLLHL